MSISPNGKYVVTSGHDKTLRLWEKTQEPLVLDDERENEREKEEEEQLATGDRPHANDQDREAGLPSKKTALSEKSAEKLMEAIQTYKQYKTECAESLKGNFFWLINNVLKSLFIFFYQITLKKKEITTLVMFNYIFKVWIS